MDQSSLPLESLRYAAGGLDRASSLRTDSDWVRQQLEHEASLVVPVFGAHSLFAVDALDQTFTGAILPRAGEIRTSRPPAGEVVLLGLRESIAIFAVELSADASTDITRQFGGQFEDLRLAGACLSGPDAALLAYGRGLLHWHRTHQYCGSCGAQMDSAHGGHMRRCPTCARETFPRIDSAVIMLVETTNETGEPICLLGRHARLPTGIFSTLAGFVETGESLEETVVREVMEESGVKVDRVDYRGSQPWPFPASLMLGFRTRATTTDISAHDDELEAVAWFTAEELSGFGEWSDEAAEFRLPRRDSIARVLIDEWLAEHRTG